MHTDRVPGVSRVSHKIFFAVSLSLTVKSTRHSSAGASGGDGGVRLERAATWCAFAPVGARGFFSAVAHPSGSCFAFRIAGVVSFSSVSADLHGFSNILTIPKMQRITAL